MPRTSPKSWGRRKAGGKKSARKSAPRTGKGAQGLAGRVKAVRSAPNSHRFSRPSPTYNIVSNVGGAPSISVIRDDVTTTGSTPFTLLGLNASSYGATDVYQFGGSLQFKLSDVTAYSDFTELFDHYTIDQVDIEVTNLHNSANTQQFAALMPTIMYVCDFDDATPPVAAQYMNEFQRAKSWTFRGDGQPLKFSVRPRIASTVYATGVTAAYGPGKQGQLIDSDRTDVPFYGVKFWIQDAYITGTSAAIGETNLRWKMKYHLKMVDPK